MNPQSDKKNHFNILYEIDFSKTIKIINELSYIPWANSWIELKKRYPCATYELLKFNDLPYVFDPLTGYMVFTTVTVEHITLPMWLPVMNLVDKPMKDKSYEYITDDGKKEICEAATMFDINTAIMRCLTKNIAMFGAGISVYAKENLSEKSKIESVNLQNKNISNEQIIEIETLLSKQTEKTLDIILKTHQVSNLHEISICRFDAIKKALEHSIKKHEASNSLFI